MHNVKLAQDYHFASKRGLRNRPVLLQETTSEYFFIISVLLLVSVYRSLYHQITLGDFTF